MSLPARLGVFILAAPGVRSPDTEGRGDYEFCNVQHWEVRAEPQVLEMTHYSGDWSRTVPQLCRVQSGSGPSCAVSNHGAAPVVPCPIMERPQLCRVQAGGLAVWQKCAPCSDPVPSWCVSPPQGLQTHPEVERVRAAPWGTDGDGPGAHLLLTGNNLPPPTSLQVTTHPPPYLLTGNNLPPPTSLQVTTRPPHLITGNNPPPTSLQVTIHPPYLLTGNNPPPLPHYR